MEPLQLKIAITVKKKKKEFSVFRQPGTTEKTAVGFGMTCSRVHNEFKS